MAPITWRSWPAPGRAGTGRRRCWCNAGLGGKRGDGRKVAGTFGLDHQLGALAVQDLADEAVEQREVTGCTT